MTVPLEQRRPRRQTGDRGYRLLSRDRSGTGRALLLLAIEDVTERVAAFEALRQADRRKDEFLGMLAHELRGPLAPIRNALEIWRSGDAHEAALRQAQAIMDRQLRKEAGLVDDSLDVSRITSGAVALKKKPVDLVSVVHLAVESTRDHSAMNSSSICPTSASWWRATRPGWNKSSRTCCTTPPNTPSLVAASL